MTATSFGGMAWIRGGMSARADRRGGLETGTPKARPYAFVRSGDQARIMRMSLEAANDNTPLTRPRWGVMAAAVVVTVVAISLVLRG